MNTSQETKRKICIICGDLFTPYKTIDRICSYSCSRKYQDRKAEEKKQRETTGEKKAQRYIEELTYWFNRYIRLRDRGKNCITCNKNLGFDITKYDAGHCFGSGAYPELRYNDLNTWGQCKKCNQYDGGNFDEYRALLPQRIGQDNYDELVRLKNTPRKYGIFELKALILKYKKLCKDIEIVI